MNRNGNGSAVGGRGILGRSGRSLRRQSLLVVVVLCFIGLSVVSTSSSWFSHVTSGGDDPSSSSSPTTTSTSHNDVDAGSGNNNKRRDSTTTTDALLPTDDAHQLLPTQPHHHTNTTAPSWHCSFPIQGGGGGESVTRVRSPPSRSFVPLTHFNFWGTTMNTSSPCPTSGLNNQLTMLIGLLHCSLGQRHPPAQAVPASFLQKGVGIGSGGSVATAPPSFVVVTRGGSPPGTATYISSNPLWEEGDASTSPSSSSCASTISAPPQQQQQSPHNTPLLLHHQTIAPAFFFKDITCSPTGGKEGGTSFKVGSADYEYAWFRWSEVFDVERGMRELGVAATAAAATSSGGGETGGSDISVPSPPPTSAVFPLPQMCLRDEFSWGEHAWMKRNCPTTVDHIYGTPRYWWLRRALPLHDWYYSLVHTFLHTSLISTPPQRHSSPSTTTTLADNEVTIPSPPSTLNDDAPSPPSTIRASLRDMGKGILAIHVRRGDYFNFCKNTAKSSGVKKFIIATHRWLRGAPAQVPNSTSLNNTTTCSSSQSKYLGIDAVNHLSTKFMDACVPSNERIFKSIEDVLNRHDEAAASKSGSGGDDVVDIPITTLLVATNSNAFLAAARQHFTTMASTDPHKGVGGVKGRRSGIERVLSFSEYYTTLKQQHQKQGPNAEDSPLSKVLQKVAWPNRLDGGRTGGGAASPTASTLTTTERSLVDVALLSIANTAILNKYSTFSQSAVDFRAVREGSLTGLRLYWW